MINRIKYRCKAKHVFLTNLFLINKINIYDLEIDNDSCSFYIKRNQQMLLEKTLKQHDKEFVIIKDNTIRNFFGKNVLRYGLYIGIVVAILLISIWSLSVTDIKIEGNELVEDTKITSVIEENYKLPTFKASVNEKILTENIMAIDGISNASVIIKGNVIFVKILEELQNPNIIDYGEKNDLISKYDAVITSIGTYSGEAKVKVGDTIKKGDVLISHEKVLADGTILESKAMGDVYGRVWLTKHLVFTPTVIEKVRTGRKKTYFVNREKDFNFDIDYKQYEIEISDFFSCSVFPIKLKKIVIYETKEIEKEFNFSEEKDGIINAEIVNIERDLPQGAQKTRYWYFEKIVDKNTYLDLYYEIVVKLA